ncbi:MAG: response regulator [Anaerolineae bacterium]
MSESIRIIIVDDNHDIHDAIMRVLDGTDDIELVGQAYDGEAGIQLCRIARPDLVLMDVVMPGMSGADATATILKELPETRILVLSSFHEYEYIQAMLSKGAVGYLVKDSLVQELVITIRNTLLGNHVLSPEVMNTLFDAQSAPAPDFELSERELQVIQLMAEGLTYKGIARKLRITSPTVRFHTNNILEKMQVETRSEALVLAAKYKLV